MFEDDKHIALEICKAWLDEKDAAFLAKENQIILWTEFNPETKRGEWTRYKLRDAVRIIKATRAGLLAMKFINAELLMLAAQETERAYAQAVTSKSIVPPEFFNLNRAGYFNNMEILAMCLLQTLVGRGWNIEANCLGELMKTLYARKGFAIPNRHTRWKYLRAVAGEAGVVIRDRTDRLTVYGVGRFVAIQIAGLTDSIKTELTADEVESVVVAALTKFNTR